MDRYVKIVINFQRGWTIGTGAYSTMVGGSRIIYRELCCNTLTSFTTLDIHNKIGSSIKQLTLPFVLSLGAFSLSVSRPLTFCPS